MTESLLPLALAAWGRHIKGHFNVTDFLREFAALFRTGQPMRGKDTQKTDAETNVRAANQSIDFYLLGECL